MKFLKSLFKQKLSREAFGAYFYRLPSSIEVSWFRDGKYIVGTIKTEDQEFSTQGLDADDFIEMVNDAVYTMYDIPDEYIDLLKTVKTYSPQLKEKQKLQDASIKNSIIRFLKNEEVLQTA